ncbi:putative sensor (PAS) domain for methyl-accepting chemotaxis sensory transducer [hydrothermal vent metagenome]|uniref:Putative sensor (PAS) domain for methyl-accepting chemotaxis sensory transducer n=1 Tax=hydrothermal vent metagenome TaxID=652676 RepID=A0A3B0TYR1_9ZZZZ
MEPEGKEILMEEDDLIVSKTDKKGWITYCNRTCAEIAEYEQSELVGVPHSIFRSRAMPRSVFKLLWERISEGHEIFAYVVNKSKNDNHYWVFAHVTPSRDENGNITGYHSNRRKPFDEALSAIKPLYAALLEEEQRHGNRKEGLAASTALLNKVLEQKGVDYDEFVLTI